MIFPVTWHGKFPPMNSPHQARQMEVGELFAVNGKNSWPRTVGGPGEL